MTTMPALEAAPRTFPLDTLRLLVREGGEWRPIDSAITPHWKLAIALLQSVVEGRARFVDKDGNGISLDRITCDAAEILRGLGYCVEEDASGETPFAWVRFTVAGKDR